MTLYFASTQTRTLGGTEYVAVAHAESGIIAWVRADKVASIVARLNS